MTQDKWIVLPEREEMLTRLRSVIDEPHTESGFYSLLLKYAGARKTGTGVSLILLLAVADYTEDQPPVIAVTIGLALPRFVAALVDDEEVAAQALAGLKMS